MHLPVDPRAPGRKRAAEGWARAQRPPVLIPPGFHADTPVIGEGARILFGEIEERAGLPVVREWNPAMERLIHPPPTFLELRADVAAVGAWGTRHAGWPYSMDEPPRANGLALPRLTHPLDTDCSKWYQIACKWAGVPATHDPMGVDYATYGNTENILRTLRGVRAITDLQLGDPVVWGHLGASHHVAFVIADAGKADPLLSSHGRPGGPFAVRYSIENRSQIAGGHYPQPLTLF